MFVQIIRGKVSETCRRPMDEGARADRWKVAGSDRRTTTSLLVLVRFESEEAARANSNKPAQGEWGAEMEKLLDAGTDRQHHCHSPDDEPDREMLSRLWAECTA